MVIFHLLIAAAPGRINGWFNEGILELVRTGIAELQ
jgi:hypothetical protein